MSEDTEQTGMVCASIVIVLCTVFGGFIAGAQRSYTQDARRLEVKAELLKAGVNPHAITCSIDLNMEECRKVADIGAGS